MTRIVNYFLSVSQGKLATTALISAVRKTVSGNLFGVDKYLTYGTPVHFFALNRSEERAWIVDSLMNYIAGLEGVIPSGCKDFARMAAEVLDELLMNVIWDANPARNELDRTLPVFLKPSQAVRVEWGVDGSLLALCVRSFRHLTKRKLGKVSTRSGGPQTQQNCAHK